MLHNLEHCESDSDQNSHAFEEEEIPDDKDGLQRDFVYEDLDEPRESQQVGIEINIVEVTSQLRVS
jgi:hypothetical protein